MSTPPTNSHKNSNLPTPFSLRLTFEERAALDQAAGDQPLGSYIRSKLFEGDEAPRKPRKRPRSPVKDVQKLGEVLGRLGNSKLANNLNQLAKAANTGSLPVTPDTEKALGEACAAVQDMRKKLMLALGYTNSGG